MPVWMVIGLHNGKVTYIRALRNEPVADKLIEHFENMTENITIPCGIIYSKKKPPGIKWCKGRNLYNSYPGAAGNTDTVEKIIKNT